MDFTFTRTETFTGPRTGLAFDIGTMGAGWQVRYVGLDGTTRYVDSRGDATLEAARVRAVDGDAFEHATTVLARIVGAMRYHAEPTRAQYEAACADLDLAPMTDAECARYRAYEHAGEPNARVIGLLSWSRHLRAGREAAEVASATPVPAPTLHAWGSRGARYDERCEVCRRVSEVDNVTGACSKHHAAAGGL